MTEQETAGEYSQVGPQPNAIPSPSGGFQASLPSPTEPRTPHEGAGWMEAVILGCGPTGKGQRFSVKHPHWGSIWRGEEGRGCQGRLQDLSPYPSESERLSSSVLLFSPGSPALEVTDRATWSHRGHAGTLLCCRQHQTRTRGPCTPQLTPPT